MPAAQRRAPRRSCVACRYSGEKRELVRVVRLAAGGVEVDPTGKKAGRGAYLCRAAACWQEALKRGRLEAALRTALSAEERLRLQEFVASLKEAAAAGATKATA